MTFLQLLFLPLLISNIIKVIHFSVTVRSSENLETS